VSIITAILNWQFNMKEFESSFNDFEAEIEKYDREQSTRFPDEVKTGVLISRTNGPLLEHLLLNTHLSTPVKRFEPPSSIIYRQTRRIVIYVNSRARHLWKSTPCGSVSKESLKEKATVKSKEKAKTKAKTRATEKENLKENPRGNLS
jgi:hypothetical protein